jgi:prepilin-type N-terminal cleavage/methylation domain-containing protein
MRKPAAATVASRTNRLASFTLIELLVVMAIIAILASLILFAGNAVITKGLRSRAAAEVQAMSTALEGYKTDNGIYPPSEGVLLLTNTYATATAASYQTNSSLLFVALAGQPNLVSAPTTGVKSYMAFKANQVGNPSTGVSYVKDPWGNSYGYSTGSVAGAATTNYPYNGGGFFDLWSTATQSTTVNTNAWISNWQ